MSLPDTEGGEGNPPVKGEYIALNLVEDPHRLATQVGG